MSNNKQSSVEWFAEQFAEHIEETYGMKITSLTILNKAKAMHKTEIIDAWIATDNELQRMAAERYYDETFES